MRRSRILTVLLAAYTTVLVSGAPLPIAGVTAWLTPPKTDGAEDAERFPCEACPCGCATAAHCWAECCCHTMGERLAWARREGVRPPDNVLDEAAAAGLDVGPWRPMTPGNTTPGERYAVEITPKAVSVPSRSACCAAKPACCAAAEPACCASSQPRPVDPKPKRPKSPGVSLVHALACQGLVESWLAMGDAPLPPVAELVTTLEVSPAYGFYPPLADRSADAPTPPPPEWRGPSVG